jgi:hypothetical protein
MLFLLAAAELIIEFKMGAAAFIPEAPIFGKLASLSK